MDKVIVLGCGAATGVPNMFDEWGDCDKNNPKNRRTRAGVYAEIGMAKVLIDTSADLREQYLKNGLKEIDGVLYTHAHADHLMGIDDLRGITHHMHHYLNIYADESTYNEIMKRFDYVFITRSSEQITHRPQLNPVVIKHFQEFKIKDVKITPFLLLGHSIPTTGYCFNDGELVIISDFKNIPEETLNYLSKIHVNVLIMPLTLLKEGSYHAGIGTVLDYVKKIKPEKTVFTHMGADCDYDNVNAITPDGAYAGYDGMIVDLEKR